MDGERMEDNTEKGKASRVLMENTVLKTDDVLVGVLCYNHRDYIACCLDSIFEQQCTFPFKVYVFDDISTDGSWEIILEYKERYENRMIAFQPEMNTFLQGHRNGFLKEFVKQNHAKYIAFCEADDYWTDKFKLQKQYDAMQKNANAKVCIHDVELVDVCSGKDMGIVPGKWNARWTREELITQTLTYRISFRLNSYFVNSDILKSLNLDDAFWDYWAQDIAIIIYYILNGSILYLSENMAVKRVNNVGSLSRKSNIESDVCQQQIEMFEADISWIEAFNQLSNWKYPDLVGYYKFFREIKLFYLRNGELALNKWVSNGNGKMYKRELFRKINRLYVKIIRKACFNSESKFVRISRRWMEKEWKKKY